MSELKLFGKIPYEVRNEDEPYLSIEKAEETLRESFHESTKDIPSIPEMQNVFNNNRDNPYNLHITVYKGASCPQNSVWFDFDGTGQTGIEITFEESKESFNIVKQTAKELGMTQKELAQAIGAAEATVRNWSAGKDIPEWAVKSMDMLCKIQKDQEIINTFKKLQILISER